MDEVVYFYEPYPKKMERIKMLPAGIRGVLNELDGQKTALRRALGMVKEAVKHFPCFSITIVSKKQEEGGFVFLQVKEMERIHSYKLIKFKPIKIKEDEK